MCEVEEGCEVGGGELLTEGGGQGKCVKWRKGMRVGVGNY